jgi:hypothetical protein
MKRFSWFSSDPAGVCRDNILKLCHDAFFQTLSNLSFTYHPIIRKILQYEADGFTSPQKEGVLRIFIALKHPSSSVGFEPANIGSNDKHDNH